MGNKRTDEELLLETQQRQHMLTMRIRGRALREDRRGDSLMRALGHLNSILANTAEDAPQRYQTLAQHAEKAAGILNSYLRNHASDFEPAPEVDPEDAGVA